MNGQEPSYRLTFVAEPSSEDVVVLSKATCLFLAPEVAEHMRGSVLDIDERGDGTTPVLRRNHV